MTPTTINPAPSQAVEKLAFSLEEFMSMTGLGRVSVWRAEKKGILRAVPGIKRKLYSRKAVEAFLDGKEAA